VKKEFHPAKKIHREVDMKNLIQSVLIFALAALTLGLSGCKNNPIIGGVKYSIEPNVETFKIALDFSKDIVSDLGGSFPVKDYGTIEVNPSTPDQPFSIGFRMNLEALNDNDYIHYEPVTTLPSGQPLPIPGLNRALALVKLDNKINKHFDVYTYLDVADNGKEWMGIAVLPDFMSSKYFPGGLVITKNFLKDKAGYSQVIATVFGPKTDSTGNQVPMSGGFAVFANARELIKGSANQTASFMMSQTSRTGFDKGSNQYFFHGPLAPYYTSNKKAQSAISETVRTLLRENSFGKHMM
jgi:hypothetical protein